MSDFGGSSEFPFEFGGGPSREMKTYVALKRIVGVGMSPPDDEYGDATIIESWRMAKARGLAAAASFDEAAMWQAFPDTVTDELETYEEILALFPAPETPDETRRRIVTERWTREIESAVPKLEQGLVAIDPRFSVLNISRDFKRLVYPGRVHDYLTATSGTFLNLRHHSNYPAFTDDFVLYVMFAIGNIQLTDELARIRFRAEEFLRESLPAWCDFAITHAQGFTLDSSLLDSGSFYP